MQHGTEIAAAEEYLEGGSGPRIFVRSWRPSHAARAVVAICHGLNSHSGHYDWVARRFVEAGYAVYALDLRGRGRSDGERFYVEHIDDYTDDLARLVALARTREPGLPVILLGHSAGGVVSATYVLDHGQDLAGFICESFAFRIPAPDVALSVMKAISHVVPHVHVLRLKNADFSRDPAVVAALDADPLIENEVQPTQTVAALVRADERLANEFPAITLPLLILHGTEDRVTRPAGSQQFLDAAGSADKTLKFYPGHAHDLFNDLGREEVVADVVEWMDTRVPSRVPSAVAV